MTGILSNQLPGRANPPDADNPLGSFKDRTAPGANDGSYLTQTWSNDRDSILQALFIASGLTPNGVEDTGTASQLFDALVNNRWSSIGNYSTGTIVTASDGLQYYCNSSNGRDSSVIDPVGDLTDSWRRFPYIKETISGVIVKRWYNGDMEQTGRQSFVHPGAGTLSAVINFPVSFVSTESASLATNSTAPSDFNVSITTPTATNFTMYSSSAGDPGTPDHFWTVKGRWV